MTLGRTDEAVIMGQTALDLDPLNPMIQALFGGVLTDAGEYDRAISVFEQALSIEPDHWVALGTIDDAYVLKGDYKKALEAWIDYFHLEEEAGLAISKTFDEQGFLAAIEELIVELEKTVGHTTNLDLAQFYTLVKNYPKALDLYEKSYEDRDANLPYLSTKIFSYGPFQIDDPRFNALLEKMNLPLPAE